MVNVHRHRRDFNTKQAMRRARKSDSGILAKKYSHASFFLSVVLFLCIYHIRKQDLHLSDNSEGYMEAVGKPARRVGVQKSETKTSSSRDDSSSSAASVPNPELTIVNFLPNHDPVLPRKLIKDLYSTKKQLIQVHLLFGSSESISTQARFLLEGVERSSVLQLTHTSFLENSNNLATLVEMNEQKQSLPLIWVVDMLGIGHDCHLLEKLMGHALSLDHGYDPQESNDQQLRKLLLVDYSGSSSVTSCTNVLNKLWSENQTHAIVRHVKRGIVEGRHWSFSKEWVELGNVMSYNENGVSISYSPLPLREAVISEVSNFTERRKSELNITKLRPVDVKRMNDVVHFWRKGDNSHYTFLREKVSSIVDSFNGIVLGTRKLKTLVRTFGEEEFMEENMIQGRYIEEMMSTKAIVIAQRDEWEDHYRLMESLATGALVLTDSMIGLPRELVPGKNIVVYNSTDSLKEMLTYYLDPSNDRERLSMAKKGWEVVMGHHRTWHRVEEMIFGTAITAVDHVYDKAPPPRKVRSKYKKGYEGMKLVEIPVHESNNEALLSSSTMIKTEEK